MAEDLTPDEPLHPLLRELLDRIPQAPSPADILRHPPRPSRPPVLALVPDCPIAFYCAALPPDQREADWLLCAGCACELALPVGGADTERGDA